jgi:RNA polymerase sigma factor (sigma-70 family)
MSDNTENITATRPLDRDVVATLVANHRDFLSFVEKRVGNRTVAEDILQEAFVRGVSRIDSLESNESVVAWFYRTLRNAVIDYYRRSAAAARGKEAVARELEDAVEPDLETRNMVCACVGRLADTLKPEYATALKRIEVDGLSVQDYAAEAGITANNAAVRVFRARNALRKQVSISCGTCAEHGCLDCTCGSG